MGLNRASIARFIAFHSRPSNTIWIKLVCFLLEKKIICVTRQETGICLFLFYDKIGLTDVLIERASSLDIHKNITVFIVTLEGEEIKTFRTFQTVRNILNRSMVLSAVYTGQAPVTPKRKGKETVMHIYQINSHQSHQRGCIRCDPYTGLYLYHESDSNIKEQW